MGTKEQINHVVNEGEAKKNASAKNKKNKKPTTQKKGIIKKIMRVMC